MASRRVLVVGTTTDYITYLMDVLPHSLLFLTDQSERDRNPLDVRAGEREIVSDLGNSSNIPAQVKQRSQQWEIEIVGVVCFDDDSLPLAAELARHLKLPFESPQTVANCRNKWRSGSIWRSNGISSPASVVAFTEDEAVDAMRRLDSAVVLKPFCGSGSEMVIHCLTETECRHAAWLHLQYTSSIKRPPSSRRRRRLRQQDNSHSGGFLVEEYILGQEYSCDILITPHESRLIRIARKIPASNHPPGTIHAYQVPASIPGISDGQLTEFMDTAARSLGITRAIVMADFIVRGDCMYLLEMAPRPGGDCLPPLLRHAAEFDILKAAVSLARGEEFHIPDLPEWTTLVGLRLLTGFSGRITQCDTRFISSDPRVRNCTITIGPNHTVLQPPDDYDSRILGYVIFAPDAGLSIRGQCEELQRKLILVREDRPWSEPLAS